MVFENVTLFEVHLDDARFSADADRPDGRGANTDARRDRADGRRAVDEAVADDAAAETEPADSGAVADEPNGRGRFVKLAAASVVVSVVATVVARRVAGRDDDPVEVDLEADRAFDDSGAAGESDGADDPVSTPTPDGDE